MSTTPFTARNVAKFVVKTIVHGKVAELTADTITDYTRFEEDDIVVKISSHTVGWYVSDKLQPITDRMVDKTSDFITEKRENWSAKKAPAE